MINYILRLIRQDKEIRKAITYLKSKKKNLKDNALSKIDADKMNINRAMLLLNILFIHSNISKIIHYHYYMTDNY